MSLETDYEARKLKLEQDAEAQRKADLEVRRRVDAALRHLIIAPSYLLTVGEVYQVGDVLRTRAIGNDQSATAEGLELIVRLSNYRKHNGCWFAGINFGPDD